MARKKQKPQRRCVIKNRGDLRNYFTSYFWTESLMGEGEEPAPSNADIAMLTDYFISHMGDDGGSSRPQFGDNWLDYLEYHCSDDGFYSTLESLKYARGLLTSLSHRVYMEYHLNYNRSCLAGRHGMCHGVRDAVAAVMNSGKRQLQLESPGEFVTRVTLDMQRRLCMGTILNAERHITTFGIAVDTLSAMATWKMMEKRYLGLTETSPEFRGKDMPLPHQPRMLPWVAMFFESGKPNGSDLPGSIRLSESMFVQYIAWAWIDMHKEREPS